METLTEILLSNDLDGNVISKTTIRDAVGGSEGRRWGLVHRALSSGYSSPSTRELLRELARSLVGR